jgi:hypothetical protein
MVAGVLDDADDIKVHRKGEHRYEWPNKTAVYPK